MSSTLFSALSKLDESVRVLEGRLQCLGAGLEVPKEQFTQDMVAACHDADAVRELVHAKYPDVDWADRQSLEKLIGELEAAEAGGKELRLRRLLELAEELNAGKITHRLQSRVSALESLREAAVRELLAEAAEDQPKELPGPDARAWMHWACGSQENPNPAQFSELEQDFPALLRFASEMEESYWQPRESRHEVPEQVAINGASFRAETTGQHQPLQLPDLPPALAAIYDELFSAKKGKTERTAQTVAVAPEIAEVAEATPAKSQPAAPAGMDSDVARMLAAVAAHRVNGSGSDERSLQATVAVSPEAVEQLPVSSYESAPFSYPSGAIILTEAESKGSWFSFNRSVLITVGAIAVVILVMVVMSAVSGNLTGKRSSSPPATVATDSAKASTEAPVSDLELVGQIEQRLKGIKGGSIYVTVQHGTAILEGQVPSEEALVAAEELTLQASQIKIVRNRIQIQKAGAVHSATGPTKPNAVNTP